ncbi:MAG: hypothetical protein QN151_08110 [Armatimonadota bacterium]|nr:hypothetical protein [Armatimonadota bacterium]
MRLAEELERVRRTLAEDPDVVHLTVFGSGRPRPSTTRLTWTSLW